MDEIFEQPRPRVNAELLPKFQGKHVTVLGNAGSTKPNADRIEIIDGSGATIQVLLGSSLNGTETLNGLVEVVGRVDESNNVHAVLYRELSSDPEIDLGLYNSCIKLTHLHQEFYG